MSKRLIGSIKRGTLTNRWENGAAGKFVFVEADIAYRFIRTTDDCSKLLVRPEERSKENTPTVLRGFVAFLVHNFGSGEQAMYDHYNTLREQLFIKQESAKPNSYKRDLKAEFVGALLSEEKANIEEFKKSFDYVTTGERQLLLDYAEAYLDYTTGQHKSASTQVAPTPPPFAELLIHDERDKLLALLHVHLKNVQKKEYAVAVVALIELGLLAMPSVKKELHRAMQAEFGDIGGESHFNAYLNSDRRLKIDIEVNHFKRLLQPFSTKTTAL